MRLQILAHLFHSQAVVIGDSFAIAEATFDVTTDDVFTVQLEVLIQVVTKWVVTSLVLFTH